MVHILAILSTLPLVALAIPHGFAEAPAVLHHNTRMVALDEETNRMIAYDDQGRKLGVYSVNATLPQPRGALCFPMQNGDINGIPKIGELRKKADAKWGTSGRNEVVNDKDFPDRPANICTDDAGAKVVYDAEPSYHNTVNDAAGHLEGGKVSLENKHGISMTSSSTVTKSSMWGVGQTLSTSFSFPEVVDIGLEVSLNSEFTNEQGESNTVSQDSTTLQKVEQTIDKGQTDCKLSLTTTTCSITGKASLKMISSGILWFQYKDMVYPVNGDKNDRHFKWGMRIERELPNVMDRSTMVEFKINGDMNSQTNFDSFNCAAPVAEKTCPT